MKMDSPVTIKRETAFYVNETGHVVLCFFSMKAALGQ